MSRSDPIRKNYYDYVEVADQVSDVLFYVGAVLSFVALFVNQVQHPDAYVGVQIAFTLAVISLFVIGLLSRLYLTPRAEDKRRQDFLTNAYGVDLIHQKTDGYYNNNLTDPLKRMAAQTFENSLFSKTIARRMARGERIKIAVYGALWLICLLNRQTDLGVVVAASQAVFSEQVLSKWFRLEFLRARSERTFDDFYKLFQSKPSANKFNAMAQDSCLMYETAKANAAITLSSKIFDALNPELSREWEEIKQKLGI